MRFHDRAAFGDAPGLDVDGEDAVNAPTMVVCATEDNMLHAIPLVPANVVTTGEAKMWLGKTKDLAVSCPVPPPFRPRARRARQQGADGEEDADAVRLEAVAMSAGGKFCLALDSSGSMSCLATNFQAKGRAARIARRRVKQKAFDRKTIMSQHEAPPPHAPLRRGLTVSSVDKDGGDKKKKKKEEDQHVELVARSYPIPKYKELTPAEKRKKKEAEAKKKRKKERKMKKLQARMRNRRGSLVKASADPREFMAMAARGSPSPTGGGADDDSASSSSSADEEEGNQDGRDDERAARDRRIAEVKERDAAKARLPGAPGSKHSRSLIVIDPLRRDAYAVLGDTVSEIVAEEELAQSADMRYNNEDNLSKRGDRNRIPGCWTIFGLETPVRRAVARAASRAAERRGPAWRGEENKTAQQFDYEEAMEQFFA